MTSRVEDHVAPEHSTNAAPVAPGKARRRISSASSRVLESCFARRTFPTTRDFENIRRQTTLSKADIIDWFENARQRRKVAVTRPSTPYVGPSRLGAMDVPQLTKLSSPAESMDPLQRWRNSPPEYEPASVSAIAQAVSGLPTDYRLTDDVYATNSSSARSLSECSSASSIGLSQSSKNSSASAFSHGTPESIAPPQTSTRRRRRRGRTQRPLGRVQDTLGPARYTFQCTFCTETFKTKHNWQRHEKSLHLSLEQWRCSPHGVKYQTSDGKDTCVYCSEPGPSQSHLATHNYGVCQERHPEDRTFYRKDHLQQHLKLVHDAKFKSSPMEQWKYENDVIRSRCGFCGLTMTSWTDRIDHLADHFKEGKTMADWQGDWGFETNVLDMVEKSMPPYLIHYERNSPWPFTTTQGPVESPTSAYDLIGLELEYFSTNYMNTSDRPPTDEELLYESCCIVFGAEMLSHDSETTTPGSSWLRDLLMSSDIITKQARIRPMRIAARSRITQLKIYGKRTVFEGCILEAQLFDFVETSRSVVTNVENETLQDEAWNIVSRMEALKPKPSRLFPEFLFRIIHRSSHWLNLFRQRMNLAPVKDGCLNMASAPVIASNSPHNVNDRCISDTEPFLTSYDQLSHILAEPTLPVATGTGPVAISVTPGFFNDSNCYRYLARELTRFVTHTTSPRNPNCHVPTDEELQYQARWIMYDDDDPWNQTPADNPSWLQHFKQDVGLSSALAS
ncbi:hypothetical protein BKA67DRAFT_592008 [Truncatella angustata]|uniref:C2H2-type domain-containing protein n=1 Tax=Truncatella angustata TaxID=152316 RepID=A0A9P8ZZ96_9PEZI|nr:uncharacterized protein BKA67DRAFT_592008 [Truncatella angustata]KAH6655838.1 hypothetical protein BKA67DRAFT_592008 [Truncatella angustata]